MSQAMAGLRPEQGPPLSVPMSFFFTAPLALCAAGALLVLDGGDSAGSVWGPVNVAAVHLVVLGFLSLTMIGALYQMLPVVAGAVVPWTRLAHAVHALLVAGSAALVLAQATGAAWAFQAAVALLLSALLLFVVPAGVAVSRTTVTGATAWGMRLALASLVVVVTAGAWMSSARAGMPFHGDWLALRWAHAHVGFLGWIGGLTAAVSWQVVPMFFLAPAPPPALPRLVLAGIATSLVALVAVSVTPLDATWIVWACVPGALAAWVVQPAWALWALGHRRRKRRDPSLWFWRLSMTCALACALLGMAVARLESPMLPLLYGIFVLWGFAGALVHGMLVRIVPFLAWLHHCAPRVGFAPMPSARELLPDARAARGFWLHSATLLTGLTAAVTGGEIAWRAFGVAMLLTGIHLEMMLLAVFATLRPHLGRAA